MTPYEVLFGVKVNNSWNVKDIIPEKEVLVASKRIKQMRIRRKKLKKYLLDAQATQKKYYNEKYMPKEFKIGNKVLLSIKNIWIKYIKKKLNHQ